MMGFFTSSGSFRLFGIVGVAFALMGTLVAAFVYRGKQGERYSPLNHYISELGEVGVSRFAWVFNLCLVITGLCLLPACISLGMLLPGVLAKVGIAVGEVCSVSLSLVGVFPMNKLKPHAFAAMTYFRTGLVMVFLFSLAIILQPDSKLVLSRWYALAGLPSLLSFAAFLVLAHIKSREDEEALEADEEMREDVSSIAIAEWMIFITLVLWFVLVSLGL
jgi:hypothetical membrane protein